MEGEYLIMQEDGQRERQDQLSESPNSNTIRIEKFDSNPSLQEYSSMKTTIDLPEEIIRRAKITAIQRKTTLKDLICRSLVREIESPQAGPTDAESQRQQRASALLESLDAIEFAAPIGRFDRNQAQRHSSPA